MYQLTCSTNIANIKYVVFSCRVKVIIVAVVMIILAVVITICNVTVLGVLFTNKKLQNGQVIYRMSLAFADCLVGLIVFPTFMSTFSQSHLTQYELGLSINLTEVTGLWENDTFTLHEYSLVEVPQPWIWADEISPTFINASGFFTALSLSVSVYTLVAAGFDRFMAMYRPWNYRHSSAVSIAQKATIAVWICCGMFFFVLLFVDGFKFHLVDRLFISAIGQKADTLYAVVITLPLLCMWIVTIATFVMFKIRTKKHMKVEIPKLNDKSKKDAALQKRLMGTLGIMVGAFTASFLPAAIFPLWRSSLPSRLSNPITFYNETIINSISIQLIVLILLTTNSLWNFFIYSARDKLFRKATKELYLKLFCWAKKRIAVGGVSVSVNYTGTATATAGTKV